MDFSEFKKKIQNQNIEKDGLNIERRQEDDFNQLNQSPHSELQTHSEIQTQPELQMQQSNPFEQQRQELRNQQMPKPDENFDPQKFLREKSGIPTSHPSDKCSDCNNTGIVKEPNGSVHTCWKCLQEGRLDCHSSNLPDNREIRL